MLVYGDHSEFADPRERLAEIAGELAKIQGMQAGLQRHAKLVSSLVEGGRVLQGVADSDFRECGLDRRTDATDSLGRWLYGVAGAVCRSWRSAFEDVGEMGPPPPLAGRGEVQLRIPEGFAFYSVYPEAYMRAAQRLALRAPPRVIGIRSIGTTLGAVVAAALNARPPITLRPYGDPFARKVTIAPELERELLSGDAHYVIVDEGPGQSGSSFGAVADWLEAHGVQAERIAFLPSHDGDLGPQASNAHRERWRRAQRSAAVFDAGWLTALFGPLEEFSTESPFERPKFFARRGEERLLLKFAGLGSIGECKLAMARALHSAGFTPEPRGIVHGFLVERWCAEATPVNRGDKPIGEIARYIGARTHLFPADNRSGATVAKLLEMMRRNVALVLGAEAAESLVQWNHRIGALSRRIARVRTDNRLDRQEWLRTADGRLLKTDALDHHAAHDLIGCQDMAWDVAGAVVEFDLDASESAELIRATERAAARNVDRELLDFYALAYCCFRLAETTTAAEIAGDATPAGQRFSQSARAYEQRIRSLLHQHDCCGIPQDSLVD